MIGAATLDLIGNYVVHEETSVRCWLGHHRNEQPDHVTDVVIRAGRGRNKPYPLCGSVPNVSGPRQTRIHEFPGNQPDTPEPTILDDAEAPGDEETPSPTVDDIPARCDNVPGMVWGAMASSDIISSLIRELQPHDRDDIRQDMALRYWRKALRQELRGVRPQGLSRYLTADVLQWIGQNTETAVSEPQTAEEREEGREALLKASQESRLESLEHELQIEQARFAAKIEAKRRAAKPQAILAIQWQ